MKKPNAPINLTPEMPETAAELFAMEKYPLFDIKVAVQQLGNKSTARDIMGHLQSDGISPDMPALKTAYQQQDWETIERLAHKIKGGAVYGTIRLYYALLYMELYRKVGNIDYSEQLYQQMLKVIDETIGCMQDWLKK